MDTEPEQLFVEHDGLRIAALDWGGDGEPLLLLHPNGFCAGLFHPLALRLRDSFRPIAVDLRGARRHRHARDAATGSRSSTWPATCSRCSTISASIVVVALGESLGGGVGVLVDAARPA